MNMPYQWTYVVFTLAAAQPLVAQRPGIGQGKLKAAAALREAAAPNAKPILGLVPGQEVEILGDAGAEYLLVRFDSGDEG